MFDIKTIFNNRRIFNCKNTIHFNHIFWFDHELLVPTSNWCLIVFFHKIFAHELLVPTVNWYKIVFCYWWIEDYFYLVRLQSCSRLSVVFCAVGQIATTPFRLSPTCETHSTYLTTNSELRTTLTLPRECITYASSPTALRIMILSTIICDALILLLKRYRTIFIHPPYV